QPLEDLFQGRLGRLLGGPRRFRPFLSHRALDACQRADGKQDQRNPANERLHRIDSDPALANERVSRKPAPTSESTTPSRRGGSLQSDMTTAALTVPGRTPRQGAATHPRTRPRPLERESTSTSPAAACDRARSAERKRLS